MKIEDSVALVTGANRGIGREIARALLARGASRVYGGVRDPGSVTDAGIVPVRLDITDPAAVSEAAARCADVSLLINNAGATTWTSPLGDGGLEGARTEIEVNYLGTLAMSRAFAPVLGANGGGALVNVLSALSWLALPSAGNYSAAKAATWSLTNSLRVMLRGQGTLVVGVHVGFVETDMTERLDVPKVSAQSVAAQVVDAVALGREEVLADETSRNIKALLPHDLERLYPGVQERYDAALAGAGRR